MPERWEREISKLRQLEPRNSAVRERVARGPSPTGIPPRRERVIAGIVAGAVALGGLAFLWTALPSGAPVGQGPAQLSALSVVFQTNGTIEGNPEPYTRRIETRIAYGEALDESFTTTIPPDAVVDMVNAEDVTPFLPGPTAGSQIAFEADGDTPRVSIGTLDQWPDFERFTEIQQLPDTPGEYILVFEADYPEGVARTARLVHLVEPGVVQLVATEGSDVGAALAHAYIDGRGTEGFLSESEFTEGDFGVATTRQRPNFDPEEWLEVPVEAPLGLASDVTSAKTGSFANFDAFDPDAMNEFRDLGTVAEGGVGRRLLAVEVTWRHGITQGLDGGTFERALFFFPLQVVDPAAVGEQPSQTPTLSPTTSPTGVVSIDIRRSDESTSGDPRAIATFGDQEVSMCPNGWSLVESDGTSKGWVVMDCGQDEEFLAPAGTPITLSGEAFVVDVTARDLEGGTRYATNQVPGIDVGSEVILTYEVEWEDGSEASFWLRLTVSEGPPTAEASVLKVRCGADGAEILTPVVIAQPDGVHLEVENPAGAAAVEFSLADAPSTSFGGPIGPTVSVWPIEPGSAFVECLAKMSDTGQGLQTARFEVIDPNGYWVGGGLECEEGDRSLEVSVHDTVPTDHPDDEIAIRGSLHSVQSSDEVRLPFYPEGGGAKDGRYVVVRDGRVVAFLFVGLSDETDRYGPGLTEVTGEACASSGIAQGSLS
jgi:hypothetical protein